MGTSQSGVVYAVPVSSKEEAKNETPVYRHPKFKDKLIDNLVDYPQYDTIQKAYTGILAGRENYPCLGTRELLPNGERGEYKFKTYGEVLDNSHALGRGIEALKLAPTIKEYKNMAMKFVGVYSKNREEYTTLFVTCALFGLTMIPIYDTLGPDSVSFVFQQTNLTTLFCSNNYLDSLFKGAKEKKLNKVSTIVCFEKVEKEKVAEAQGLGISLIVWDTVLEKGRKLDTPLPSFDGDSVLVISYTSGTTSLPKAAMISHKNLISLAGASEYQDPIFHITSSDVHYSYLPLAHIFEIIFTGLSLWKGASIGYWSGEVTKVKEDVGKLSPTFFVSVPRLYNRFYEAFVDAISKQSFIKRKLLDIAINTKIKNLDADNVCKHAIFDPILFKNFKKALGGRVRFMITAAAPMHPDRMKYLKVTTCVPMLEAYGQTESTGGSFITHSSDPDVSHVGGPFACHEFKLQDVPEMGYTSKDRNEDGVLCPRGEICIRGHTVFRGYYKDEQKTNETIDKDGFLHTGDIGMLLPNGALKIIDRKKNIFKLSIGEYVAPEKIESIILATSLFQEVFVYGDSLANYLVLLAVPNPPKLLSLAQNAGIQVQDIESACKNNELKKAALKVVEKQGRESGLNSFEIPKNLYLQPQPFQDQGLVTGSLKLKRFEAAQYFKDQIKKLYQPQL
mgnify:CR=1 FL=1